jgi:acetyl/propionyl-CoA carboxylase alpha subunit
MSDSTVLIANRGEIAVRIARTARELGFHTIGVHTPDDSASLHLRAMSVSVELPKVGPGGYLDIEAILAVAQDHGVSFIHPGYGFLAENSTFATRCAEMGFTFVGPSPETLVTFGDKRSALGLAAQLDIPRLATSGLLDGADQALPFLESLPEDGSLMLKAVAGGGGRGMRRVRTSGELEEAFKRCQSEAMLAFGDGAVYAEEYLPEARHIEVQVIGDGVQQTHLWERDCSLQRQRQKVVEIAPAPDVHPALRKRLLEAALGLAEAVALKSLATVEFLVAGDPRDADARFAFIECNPRIQVEHTVTEEICGLDLVALQLQLAHGRTLSDLGLAQPPETRGCAVQMRLNLETMQPDGSAFPAHGTLNHYEPPGGRGIRVDGYGYTGYATNSAFDSLIAKLIVFAPAGGFTQALAKAQTALADFMLTGPKSNLEFLRALVADADVNANEFSTETVANKAQEWLTTVEAQSVHTDIESSANRAGTTLATNDPLAVLDFGKHAPVADGPGGTSAPAANALAASQAVVGATNSPDIISAPMQGTVVELLASVGDLVRAGEGLLVMEAMKMEHVVNAHQSGQVVQMLAQPGETVVADAPLAEILASEVIGGETGQVTSTDLSTVRADLTELHVRSAKTQDENRPEAVARRRRTGQRTTRENIAQLMDDDTFVEYGALTLAARRLRMPMDELIERTPADGLVCGIGQVNNQWFEESRARTMVVAYDYTVLAGTQGKKNHQKKDRMFELAYQWRLPLVLFAEGGGGRPGDTDMLFGANLQVEAFERFGKLSGLVPLVGIASGRCFAGNAVLLGCCDVVIATANATIGMGGPAMIEGGGLGVYTPEQVGPMAVQVPNGVVDIAVQDEREAVDVARQYIAYFQGPILDWDCVDQRELRHLIPENRVRVYDVREVIRKLADIDSVLELRAGYGHGMVTDFVRIEGRPVAIIANNPQHLGGAIDSDASDKAARFMQLCDAFDIPIVTLCDTPGNMVGPEYERTALVRHCCRMFVIGANITVPLITVVLRKGYGLGAQGMAGGSFHAPLATLSWPTGEFGGMGLEGAVKLGFRDELAAIEDPEERLAEYEKRVAEMYERGKAISIATYFELDEVIDPADTRMRIISALKSVPPVPAREGKKRANIDTW